MRTYYRGPDVLITQEFFVRRSTPRRIYLIRELHHVLLVRADLDPTRPTSAHVTGGALLLVMAAWPLLDNPAAVLAAGLMIAVPGAATIACRRMNPRPWELRARYEGHEVVLYTSSDAQTFNQVGRGLRRAIEDHGSAASSYELAGG